MLNTLRNKSHWGAPMKGVLATFLLAGGGAVLAAPITVNLCATTGTTSLPGAVTAPVYGYASGACPATVAAPGGPVIAVDVGDVVTVNLTNSLTEASGMLFQGQGLPTDLTGATASGGTKSYTFTAAHPGTYLYQAALLDNAEHQVAMGLYGALVVRPVSAPVPASASGASTLPDDLTGTVLTDTAATFTSAMVGGTLTNTTDVSSCTVTGFTATTLTCALPLAGGTLNSWVAGDGYTVSYSAPGPLQAYDDANTVYQDEAVLVLSELDPALNAAGAAFDMRNFAPKYFLINGKAYPQTDPIASAAGNNLLLRYVNAGAKHHSMGVLGLRQNFIAKDGSLLPQLTHNVAAETLSPGQTGDAIAAIPTPLTVASKFAVYDASLSLHNGSAAGMGGMMTFVAAGAGSAVTTPVTSAVTLTPSKTNGTVDVALAASITSDLTTTVDAAEYFVDTTSGTGTAMGGTFGGTTAAVNATILIADLALLGPGNHTYYVHGHDVLGNWGAFSSAVLNLDKAGPVTSALTLTPNPSSGTVAVALSATGNDSATGGSNVIAAEYTVDGGAPTAMTPGGAVAPVRSLTATIPSGLSAGPHSVAVRSQDALGNWGANATIVLNVAAAGGPVTDTVTATPNPNNGTLPFNATLSVVRVKAHMQSTGSIIRGAEGFIDTNPATTVRGFRFAATDGAWNSASENGFADIPLATINALTSGNHSICVRGRDATGRWGATTCITLIIERIAPTISAATLSATTVAFGTAVTLNVTAADNAGGTGISGGQFWIDGTARRSAADNDECDTFAMLANRAMSAFRV